MQPWLLVNTYQIRPQQLGLSQWRWQGRRHVGLCGRGTPSTCPKVRPSQQELSKSFLSDKMLASFDFQWFRVHQIDCPFCLTKRGTVQERKMGVKLALASVLNKPPSVMALLALEQGIKIYNGWADRWHHMYFCLSPINRVQKLPVSTKPIESCDVLRCAIIKRADELNEVPILFAMKFPTFMCIRMHL